MGRKKEKKGPDAVPWKLQGISWEVLKLRWPFRGVLTWGILCMDQSEFGLPQEGDISLDLSSAEAVSKERRQLKAV